MQHYVGLDVSLKQTAVCVVDQAGKIVREGMVASDPDAIAQFIAAHAPDAVRIGLEAGATSTWLWTELHHRGLPVICIDARHAEAALKMQINKSDRNDAAGIARIMQCGWYREVRVKDLDSHAIRALLSSRALLVKMKRDIENQIRLEISSRQTSGMSGSCGSSLWMAPCSSVGANRRILLRQPCPHPRGSLVVHLTADDPWLLMDTYDYAAAAKGARIFAVENGRFMLVGLRDRGSGDIKFASGRNGLIIGGNADIAPSSRSFELNASTLVTQGAAIH